MRVNALSFLLIFGLALRSLVASGFMLDTNTADGLFTIKLCDGPSGINALPVAKQQLEHAHHSHHVDHAGDDTNEHQHDAEAHDFSVCHLWSAGSTLLAQQTYIEQIQLFRFDEHLHYLPRHNPRHVASYRHARAPPALV